MFSPFFSAHVGYDGRCVYLWSSTPLKRRDMGTNYPQLGKIGRVEPGYSLIRAGISRLPGVFDSKFSSVRPQNILLDSTVASARLGKKGASEDTRKSRNMALLKIAGLRDKYADIAPLIVKGETGTLLSEYWKCDTRKKGMEGPVDLWEEYGLALQGFNLLLTTVHFSAPGDIPDLEAAWAMDRLGVKALYHEVQLRLRQEESSDDDSGWNQARGLTVAGATFMVREIGKVVEKSVRQVSISVAQMLDKVSQELPVNPTAADVAEAWAQAPLFDRYPASFHPAQGWVQELMMQARFLNVERKQRTTARTIKLRPKKIKGKGRAERQPQAPAVEGEDEEKEEKETEDMHQYCCFGYVRGDCQKGEKCHFGHPDKESALYKATAVRADLGGKRPSSRR